MVKSYSGSAAITDYDDLSTYDDIQTFRKFNMLRNKAFKKGG